MAEPNKATRLSPPLMFAFRQAHAERDARVKLDARDESGVRVIGARRSTRAGVKESQLRELLQRDLDNLLNTTNLDSICDLDDFEHVKSSIANYGIPDVVNRTIDETRTASIVDEIRTAIHCYEPRLIKRTVRVHRDASIDPASLKIRFVVSGDMSCDPVAVPVEFVADLEVASGKLAIMKL